jgi:hypothetical protein
MSDKKKDDGYEPWIAAMDQEMEDYKSDYEELFYDLINEISALEKNLEYKIESIEIDIKDAKEDLKNNLSNELVYVIDRLKQEIKQKYTISPITELFIWGYGIWGLSEIYKYYF